VHLAVCTKHGWSLLVFLLECLSGLKGLLAPTYDDVGQIPSLAAAVA
jgi:hypothetical protein